MHRLDGCVHILDNGSALRITWCVHGSKMCRQVLQPYRQPSELLSWQGNIRGQQALVG